MTPTDPPNRENPQDTPRLSPIELRCLRLAAEGRTPRDIVLSTDLPLDQVTQALARAMEKLDARNVTGAISRAARLKLI